MNDETATVQPNNDEPQKVWRGEASAEEITAWKKEHPQGIYPIYFLDADGKSGAVVYFKKPNRNDLNYSKSKRNAEAYDEQFLALAGVTCIGGARDEVFKDEQKMIKVCAAMEQMDVGAAGVFIGGNL